MPPARKSRFADLRTLALLGAIYALWTANFAFHAWHPLPLAVHVLVAAAAIHLAFTVWHEAVHRNASPRPWVNTAVGILGMFPYLTPYFMQRWIHLQHHARLNERDDPNFVYVDGPFWKIAFRYPRALGTARALLARDPRARGERLADAASTAAVGLVFALAWRAGALADLLWLWLLPVAIAKLVLGHNYHAIHHLWPTIPWHGYRSTFRERLPMLRQHGAPIEHRVFERRFRGPGLPAHTPASG